MASTSAPFLLALLCLAAFPTRGHAAEELEDKPFNGLNVGTDPGLWDLAHNGNNTQWTLADPYVVPPGETFVDFYFSLNESAIDPGAPHHVFIDPSFHNAGDVGEMNGPDGIIRVAVGDENQRRLHYDVTCFEDGNFTVVFGFEVQGYASVEVPVLATCSGNLSRKGFTVATATNAQGNVVDDGQFVAAFSTYLVKPDQDTFTFYVWLDDSVPENDSQTFTVGDVDGDFDFMFPIVSPLQGPQNATRRGDAGDPVANFTIDFQCDEPGTAEVTVDLDMADYEPIGIIFQKQCFDHPIIPVDPNKGKGGDGGWSPVGIFFFTLFMLTVLACVFGCAFNHIKRGRTGWHMVPGYMFVSSLLSKDTARYTPQADLHSDGSAFADREIHSNATYGAL